ncbi:MAG: hypothetical protein HYZ38_25685 [Mycobacterium sp.]|nr:hypothetical protein [Mycobacterium sp.]
MRTAVVRVRVDQAGELTAEQLGAGMTELATLAAEAGAELIENNLAALPPSRREVELLMTGMDPEPLTAAAIDMCHRAFGTAPQPGVLTFVSHGTDEDARGVLAGFGLTGVIERIPGDEGWDIVTVTLDRNDLRRVPESRIHTALEASLNCEVRILTV